MELKRAFLAIALLLPPLEADAQQTQSTVNPNVPPVGFFVEESGPQLRDNFQRVINDLNVLFGRAGISTARIRLTAPLDLYFNYSGGGNNSNDCMTPATACKTIQFTFQTFLSKYDTAGFTTNFHAITTDTEGLTIRSSWVGGGPVVITGPGALPGTIGIDTSVAGVPAIILAAPVPAPLVVSALYISGSIGIDILASSLLLIDPGVNFGPATIAHIVVNNAGASVNCATGGVIPPFTYTISGSAPIHYDAESGFINCSNYTVNLVGTPAFSTAFVKATNSGSALNLSNWAFTGSATGPKYLVSLNGSIITGTAINCAASPAYLPGNSAGSCSSGGQIQ